MTKVISLPRGWGKTTRLVGLMANNPSSIFVAPTRAQAEVGRRTAISLGLNADPSRFISAGALQALADEKSLGDVTLLIDEADGVISSLLGARVAAIALTEALV